jgi:hypothetical protein
MSPTNAWGGEAGRGEYIRKEERYPKISDIGRHTNKIKVLYGEHKTAMYKHRCTIDLYTSPLQ